MKYLLIAFVLQFFMTHLFAASVTSRIDSFEPGINGESYLIMLENGHTAFLEGDNKSLIESVERSLLNGDTVKFELDQKRNVLSLQSVAPLEEQPQAENQDRSLFSYDPSIVTSAEASSAFRGMRRDYQNESQCYNRAHIWTYEEFNRTGMKSGKLFLFFTSRYIRNYRYKWWFHVTPMAYVGGTTQENWRTMDRRYTKGLLSTRTWTNVFMLNNAFCPVVYNWGDYRNHQQSQDCYLIPTSMYYWQPRDIRNRSTKNSYIRSEVNHAYYEAF